MPLPLILLAAAAAPSVSTATAAACTAGGAAIGAAGAWIVMRVWGSGSANPTAAPSSTNPPVNHNDDAAQNAAAALNTCADSAQKTGDHLEALNTTMGVFVDNAHHLEQSKAKAIEAIQDAESTLNNSNACMTNAAPKLIEGAAKVERVAGEVIASLKALKQNEATRTDDAIRALEQLTNTLQTTLQDFKNKFQVVMDQNITLRQENERHIIIAARQHENCENLQTAVAKAGEFADSVSTQVAQKIARKTTPKSETAKSGHGRHRHDPTSPLHTPRTPGTERAIINISLSATSPQVTLKATSLKVAKPAVLSI